MQSLFSFQNLHQNSSIVVCGCGESLNDLVQPERFITIGVNDVGRKFQPNYLVVVNPPDQFSGDRFRYVETSRAEYLFTQLDLGIEHPNIVKFPLGQLGGTDFSNPNVLHYTNNSPYIALCLAIQMGAKRIGLIGVDFTDHHFFAKTGRHPLAPQFEVINEQYRRLAEAAKSLDIEIFNLSNVSRLTAFPKISLSEFENLSAIVSENDQKSAALKIVSYATTPVAGVPAILARCINARTEYSARCVWATNSYGNGVSFAGDVEWREKPEEAESLVAEADLIIVHNGKLAPEHEKLFKDKAIVTMAHNYLWNVDGRFFRQHFPGVVVGQYQATLPEFKNWMIVPNPMPFWEAEYRAENKPDQITICYTPSGKHEQYSPEHKLYWHSKGYETTMKVLEKLSKQFPIKLEVITDRQISHAESVAMKRRSHIVIDECVTGSYHRNSLEGLAAGCVVVNGLGILPEVIDVLRLCSAGAAEIPFTSSTLENLERVLRELIESGKDALTEKGLKNRVWMEENWDFARQWELFWMPAIEKSLRRINRKIWSDKPEKTVSGATVSQEGSQKMKHHREGVSVVIPHGGKKRLPHLRACLANLRQCGGVGEIIVVEMDERPSAVEIARKWADKYVFLHRADLFERARALNTGSAFAECEFVLWLDNDLLVPRDFISRAAAELRERNLDYLLPYSEIKYLSYTDSEKVMQGVLKPDECQPIHVYNNASTDGGAGIVRRNFLQRHGGIPAGFRGWGGEDNGWMHKVCLLGKEGRSSSDQILFHLYHALSGGNGGNAHIIANPHYQNNLEHVKKMREVFDPPSFLKDFPAAAIRLWEDSRKIYFIAGEDADDFPLISNLARELSDLFGIEAEIIAGAKAGKNLAKANLKQLPDAIVFFDTQTALEFISKDFFAPLIEKTIVIAGENFSITPDEESNLRQVFAVLTADESTAHQLEKIKSKSWVWKFNDRSGNLALTLAQPLSLIVNNRESLSEPKKQTAANDSHADFPVWFYWEGKRPGWIEACHQTILSKAPKARFLTPETFDELWTTDRDINVSRLYVAHRADFIRAFLLAKFGGLWVDADCIVMRDLRILLDKLYEYDFIAHRERSGYFSNDLMAAKPGSIIAARLYEKICQTLRKNQVLNWLDIGGEPLTEILHRTEARFLEVDCERIQPVCWSEPEKFFAAGSEPEHERNFDEQAICYMLSNGAIINYQNKNPNADLTAENTFFSFLTCRALQRKQTTDGNASTRDNGFQIQIQNNGKPKNQETAKNENRWQALSFYLETIAKIAPQKVLDIDVGFGRWAVLLRDLFESSADKKEWQMSIEALVETKPKARETAQFFYDRVRVGKLNDYFQSFGEKQDLLILGDYLTRNSGFQNGKILEQTLNLSDYILLNLNRPKKNGAGHHPNGAEGLINYLESHPEQIADYQAKDDSVSILLSQNDPKNLRPRSRLADIFGDAAQSYARQNAESITGPGCSLKQTTEIRRSLPLLFASLEINSMLDARCGDFNWLWHLDLRLEKYIGVDIVPSIIEQNRKIYESQNRKFLAADITKDFLPQCDLIFCRDYLVHLSLAEIFSALRNFCNSGAKYLLMTAFTKTRANSDIQTGDWRPLNFQLSPFEFPSPLRLLNENLKEGNGEFADKSLGLWNISDIYTFVNKD